MRQTSASQMRTCSALVGALAITCTAASPATAQPAPKQLTLWSTRGSGGGPNILCQRYFRTGRRAAALAPPLGLLGTPAQWPWRAMASQTLVAVKPEPQPQ